MVLNREQFLNRDQLECLASPSRNAVYTALRVASRGTAASLAATLGRKASGVHYHLQELERSGLISVVELKRGRRRPESVYAPAHERITLPTSKDPEVASLRRKATLARLRQSMREFDAAMQRDSGPISILATPLRLSEADLEEFESAIESALDVARSRHREDGVTLMWTSTLVPLPDV